MCHKGCNLKAWRILIYARLKGQAYSCSAHVGRVCWPFGNMFSTKGEPGRQSFHSHSACALSLSSPHLHRRLVRSLRYLILNRRGRGEVRECSSIPALFRAYLLPSHFCFLDSSQHQSRSPLCIVPLFAALSGIVRTFPAHKSKMKGVLFIGNCYERPKGARP